MRRKKFATLERNVAKQVLNSRKKLLWFRFKKNKMAVAGLVLLAVLVLVSFTSPLYIDWQDVIRQDLSNAFLSPGTEGHIFGTDMFGRDLFSRIMWGGIISLSMGVAVITGALILSIILGSLSGYFGGRIDFFIMRLVDILMAIPYLLLVMTLIVALGRGTFSLLLAMILGFFPGLARLVRSSIMTVRENEYVDAAKCYGSSTAQILMRHILPNGIGPVVVNATLLLASVILSIAGLGFLGLGIAPPIPEWGTILSEVRDHIRFYPFLGIIPGVAIALSVLCINFIGDGFRDALDPRTKK